MTKVIGDYYDILLQEDVRKGTELFMTIERAQQVREAGYIEIIGGE